MSNDDKIIDLLSKGRAEFPYHFYDYQIKTNIDFGPDHRLTYSRFYGDDILRFSTSDRTSDIDGGTTESEFGVDWPWGNHTNGLTWRWIMLPSIVARRFLASSGSRFDFDFLLVVFVDFVGF